jgi:hypothetical protein
MTYKDFVALYLEIGKLEVEKEKLEKERDILLGCKENPGNKLTKLETEIAALALKISEKMKLLNETNFDDVVSNI